MITEFKIFENTEDKPLKGKFVNVDYKIFHKTWQNKPIAIVTDYKIHKIDGDVEIIGKGYEYVTLNDHMKVEFKDKKKKGWIPFDDTKSKNIRTFPKKTLQDGSKRIKVFNL
jgi:hypothetical protein